MNVNLVLPFVLITAKTHKDHICALVAWDITWKMTDLPAVVCHLQHNDLYRSGHLNNPYGRNYVDFTFASH